MTTTVKPIRNCHIADLEASLIKGATLPSEVHSNKRVTEQIGRLIEAVANVIDKVEHGFNEADTIEKYARIAGCTANVLQWEVNQKRYGGQHG